MLLPRPAVAALAQGDQWLPAWRDVALRDLLFDEANAVCSAITDLSITYAGGGLTRVIVSVERSCFTEAANASAMKQSLTQALSHVGANRRLIASADRVEIAPILV